MLSPYYYNRISLLLNFGRVHNRSGIFVLGTHIYHFVWSLVNSTFVNILTVYFGISVT